jgi:hypothetical protein
MSDTNFFRIGVASRTYDLDGAVILTPLLGDTNLKGNERRVSRTKTLDGGVVITDSGLAAGDRTFEISLQSEKSLWEVLWSIFTDSLWVTISTDEACFLAKIKDIQDQGGKIKITALIKEDLTV